MVPSKSQSALDWAALSPSCTSVMLFICETKSSCALSLSKPAVSLLSSSIIAFFYFVAIPTVIRSRLTTDTSAMSSLANSQVTLLELINNNQALVRLNGKKIVVDRAESNSYTLKNEYKLVEEDGKLII